MLADSYLIDTYNCCPPVSSVLTKLITNRLWDAFTA